MAKSIKKFLDQRADKQSVKTVIVISLIVGALLGGFFTAFGTDLYNYTKDSLVALFSTPKLTNSTLQQETIKFYKDTMEFLRVREANEPIIDYNNWQQSVNNQTNYSKQTVQLFQQQYGYEAIKLRQEYLLRGLQNNDVEMSYQNPTNLLGIQMLANGFADLAAKLHS